MPEQSVIVWDLETIPDLAAAARMLDMEMAEETEVRQAIGSGFPKHPLHKIVSIGALIASRQPDGWQVDALFKNLADMLLAVYRKILKNSLLRISVQNLL
jgi:predicted PolB exonuclease-like 3'-5' exonuclease